MKFAKVSLEKESSVKIDFNIGEITTAIGAKRQILLIHYSSQREATWRDLQFMNAMRLAAVNLWSTDALILDFENLRYSGGDTMEFLFQNPYPLPSTALQKIFEGDSEKRFPIVAICSSANRAALTTLVRDEMGTDPSKILFSCLGEAAVEVERALQTGL
jgi:hypothetical protein